jgi:hypothetical protein
LRATVIDSVQPPGPEHAPLQPANVEPEAAVALSATEVPLAKFAVQLLPQLMPVGLDVTVPLPVPARVTASAKLEEPLNVAVTARAAVIDTVQVPVPEHAPLQPANDEPLEAAAVSVTEAPLAMFALQVEPQLMPPVFDVTVPEPVPALLTVSANVLVLLVKAAVTDRAAVIETAIQQAMRRGEFDDLPGAGKPIPGLGANHDPDWWIRRKIESEQLSGLGPPALMLRVESAELEERLDALARERDVREAVEDFNRRIVEARRQLQGGPPVVTPVRDVDAEVVAWRDRRATPERQQGTEADPPRRRPWWRRPRG